ncbi:hypothetical protein EIP91_010666 [Steccherinum ochraceum]|uniref:F-box domain-containing protein n=1 Tax=Steccherinum ochraceum TaxID=92696 RepID=A0A4R0RJC6_9APHY|nr:hypothetical protein EIP91_010666 [Steccherinum ochraceum]
MTLTWKLLQVQTSAIVKMSSLPIEVCERVMDFFAVRHPQDEYEYYVADSNWSSLANLCLVCREWVHHARFLLYFQLQLRSKEHVQRLIDGLVARPQNGAYTRVLDIKLHNATDQMALIPLLLSRYLCNLESLEWNGLGVADVFPHFYKSMSLFRTVKAVLVSNTSDAYLSHATRLALALPRIEHIALYSIAKTSKSLSFWGRPPSSLSSISLVLEADQKLGPMFRTLTPCASHLTRFALMYFTADSPSPAPLPIHLPTVREVVHFLRSAPLLLELRLGVFSSSTRWKTRIYGGFDFKHNPRLRILQLQLHHDGNDYPTADEVQPQVDLALRLLSTVTSPDLSLICIIWRHIRYPRLVEEEALALTFTEFNTALLKKFNATSKVNASRPPRSFDLEDDHHDLVVGATVLSEETVRRAVSFSQGMSPYPTNTAGPDDTAISVVQADSRMTGSLGGSGRDNGLISSQPCLRLTNPVKQSKPFLPIEVCEHIMDRLARKHPKHAHNFEYKRQTFRELFALCLVCKDWLHHARYLLYGWVDLRDKDHLNKLIVGLEARPSNGNFVRYLYLRPKDGSEWLSSVPYLVPRYLTNLELISLSRVNLTHLHPHFYRSMALFKNLKSIQLDDIKGGLLHHGLRLALGMPGVQHIGLSKIKDASSRLLSGALPFTARPRVPPSSIAFALSPSLVEPLSRILSVLGPCTARLTRVSLLFDAPTLPAPAPEGFVTLAEAMGRFLRDTPMLQELRFSLYCTTAVLDAANLDFSKNIRLRVLQIYFIHDGTEYPTTDEIHSQTDQALCLLSTLSSPDLVLICMNWEHITYTAFTQDTEIKEVFADFEVALLRKFKMTSRVYGPQPPRYFARQLTKSYDNTAVGITVLSEVQTIRAISFRQAVSQSPT